MWEVSFNLKDGEPRPEEFAFLLTPGLREASDLLRKKWGKTDEEVVMENQEDLIGDLDFQKEVRLLMLKFKIPRYHFDFMMDYIMNGMFAKKQYPDSISLHIDINNNLGKPRYYLSFDDTITEEDFKKCWLKIKELTKIKRKREWTYFRRDRKIFSLHRQNKSIQEIQHSLKHDYPALDPATIKKAVSEFYTMFQTPKDQRMKLKTKES